MIAHVTIMGCDSMSDESKAARAPRCYRTGFIFMNHRAGRPIFRIIASLLLMASINGCSGFTGPRDVTNPDPHVKVPEIRKAVDRHDMSVAPQLIEDLDASDSAVRFYAIEGLRRLTGEDFDYDWTAQTRAERRPAIDRWKKWLAEHSSEKSVMQHE